MTDTPKIPKESLEAWLSESLRCTLFLLPGTSPTGDPAAWWALASGSSPESRNENLREASITVEGAFREGRLLLRADPLRIDWAYAPTPAADFAFPSVGQFNVELDHFRGALGRWIPEVPSCVRVAFGATLWLPVQDRESGYRQIQAYLPHVEVDTASEDFFFQVNRPRQSKVIAGLRLNRLCKWSVVALRRFQMTSGGSAMQHFEEIAFAERLELDINSDASRTEVLPNVQAVWNELVSSGLEIATQGDVQ